MTSDPDFVIDLSVTKNQQINKTDLFKRVFSCLFGEGFIFSLTDDLWKKSVGLPLTLFTKIVSPLSSKP